LLSDQNSLSRRKVIFKESALSRLTQSMTPRLVEKRIMKLAT